MLEFVCPRCGRPVRVEPNLAGQTTTCPRCGSSTVVPEEALESPDVFDIPVDEVRRARQHIDQAQRAYNRLRIILIFICMTGMVVGAGFGAVGWKNLEATGMCMAGATIGLVLAVGVAALFNVSRSQAKPGASIGRALTILDPVSGLLTAAALNMLSSARGEKPPQAIDTTGELFWIVIGLGMLGAGAGAEAASLGYPRGPIPEGGWIGSVVGGLVLGSLALGALWLYARKGRS